MLGKDELIKSLEEINEKRLLSHEVTEVLDPFKETTFPLSLEFISHSRTFGKQKDPSYDGGQTGIFKIEGLDAECAVLFGSEDNEMIEKKKVGDRSEIFVCYFDYDSLYRRIVFGKVSPGTEHVKGGADLAQESAPKAEIQGITEPISVGPEIEAPQGSDNVIEESQDRAMEPSAKFKRKNKQLSFPRAQFHILKDKKRDWIAERSAEEDIKERQFKNAVGPILICGGIIFCMNGCREGIGMGMFFGVILLLFGINVRFSNKSE